MYEKNVLHETRERQTSETVLTRELVGQPALLIILLLFYNLGYPLLSSSYLGCAHQPVQNSN